MTKVMVIKLKKKITWEGKVEWYYKVRGLEEAIIEGFVSCPRHVTYPGPTPYRRCQTLMAVTMPCIAVIFSYWWGGTVAKIYGFPKLNVLKLVVKLFLVSPPAFMVIIPNSRPSVCLYYENVLLSEFIFVNNEAGGDIFILFLFLLYFNNSDNDFLKRIFVYLPVESTFSLPPGSFSHHHDHRLPRLHHRPPNIIWGL